MKTKLNILCVLIFLAIGFSIAGGIYEGFSDFLWGYKQGYDSGVNAIEPELKLAGRDEPTFVSLKSTEIGDYPDSVYNSKSGEWLPLQYRNVVVSTDKALIPWWRNVVIAFGALVICVAGILLFVAFFKLIRSINKSIIFEWDNVLKLRMMGWCMLALFFASALCAYIEYAAATTILDIPKYKITNEIMWNFDQLILGLGLLLIAEIFAVGIRLREEQELTI